MEAGQDAGRRRWYTAARVGFLAIFLATMWPVYPLFAGIEPMVFGIPLSLAYVVFLLLASFGGQLAIYLRDTRRGGDG